MLSKEEITEIIASLKFRGNAFPDNLRVTLKYRAPVIITVTYTAICTRDYSKRQTTTIRTTVPISVEDLRSKWTLLLAIRHAVLSAIMHEVDENFIVGNEVPFYPHRPYVNSLQERG